MDYIAEINAFYIWLETNELTNPAITLWYALMHTANRIGFQNKFTVAISTLEAKTNLNKKAIERARNNLQQTGRIKWKKRDGNQSAIYEIIVLCDKKDIDFVPQTVPQTVPQDDPINISSSLLQDNINKKKRDKGVVGGKEFIPPTLEEVKAYCFERKNNIDPQKFFDIFSVADWHDTKGNKIKNWKQKIITWEGRETSHLPRGQPANNGHVDGAAHPDGGVWYEGEQMVGAEPWN